MFKLRLEEDEGVGRKDQEKETHSPSWNLCCSRDGAWGGVR